MCGRSPRQGKPDSSDHSACQTQGAHVSRSTHTTRRTWPGPWKLNLKRPPNSNALQPRQSCRQPWELSHFPLLVWPRTRRLGWLACFLISDLGPPTHASEHRGCLGVGEGRVKIIPYSCFRAVRLVPFSCGHFIES